MDYWEGYETKKKLKKAYKEFNYRKKLREQKERARIDRITILKQKKFNEEYNQIIDQEYT